MINIYKIPQNGLDYSKADYGRGDKSPDGNLNIGITKLFRDPGVSLYIINYEGNTIIRCINSRIDHTKGIRLEPFNWTAGTVEDKLANIANKIKPRSCDVIAVKETGDSCDVYRLTNDGVLFDVDDKNDINLYMKSESKFPFFANIAVNDLKCNPIYAVLDFRGVTKYVVNNVVVGGSKEYTTPDNSKVLPVILWPKIGNDKLDIKAYNGNMQLSDIKYSKLSLNEPTQTLVNKNGVLLTNNSQTIGNLDVRNSFKNINIDSSEGHNGQIYKPTCIVKICSESGCNEWNKEGNKYGTKLSIDEFIKSINYMDSLVGSEPNGHYIKYPVSSSLFNYSKIYGVNKYDRGEFTFINVIQDPKTLNYQKEYTGYIYARTQYDNFINIGGSNANPLPILACVLYDQSNPEINDYAQFDPQYAISCGDFGTDLSAFDDFVGSSLDKKNINKFVYGEITRNGIVDIRFDKHPELENNSRYIQCADIYVGKYIKINVQGNLKSNNNIKVKSELQTIDSANSGGSKTFHVTSNALHYKDNSYYIRASYLSNELIVEGDHSYTLKGNGVEITRNGNSWTIPQNVTELTLITSAEQERTFKVGITQLEKLAQPITCEITLNGINTITINTKSGDAPVEFKKVTGTDTIGVNVRFNFNGNDKIIALFGDKEFSPGSETGITNIKAGDKGNIIAFKRKDAKPVTIFFALFDTDLKSIANPADVHSNWKKINVNFKSENEPSKYIYKTSKGETITGLTASLEMEKDVFKDVIVIKQFDVADTYDDIIQPISKIVVGKKGGNDNKYATYHLPNLKYHEVTSAENIEILNNKPFSQFNELRDNSLFEGGKTYVILLGVGRGNPISDVSSIETDWDNKVYTGPLIGYIPNLNNQKEFNCPKFDLNAIDWDSLLDICQNRDVKNAKEITKSTDIIESCGTAHAAYQSGNQFVYFRRSNPYNNAPLGQTVLGYNTQKESRFEVNMFEQNAIFNSLSKSECTLKNRHDGIHIDAKSRDNIDDIMNDINNDGILFAGPYLNEVNKIHINSDNTNSYLTLGPGESVEVPVVIIYRASVNVQELSFNMGFDIRNSLYNDPLYFQMTFNARYEQTASDMIGGDNGGPKYSITNV